MRAGMAARWLTVSLALGLLAGCASLPPEEPRAPSAPAETADKQPSLTPPPQPAEREPTIPAVVRDLVARARESSGAGKHEQAAAYLERALRIAPDNAALWYNLAVVRYRQGRYAQAESLALKSISLADGNSELKHQNWALIGVARYLQGDEPGARQAPRARAADFTNADGPGHHRRGVPVHAR